MFVPLPKFVFWNPNHLMGWLLGGGALGVKQHEAQRWAGWRQASEAGLEIDSQQEEEPVQASDESDLPSTSQDPPSSSSVGKSLLQTTTQLLHINLVCKRHCSVSNN